MNSCILGSQYIPSAAYFAHWLHHGTVTLEMHEHYQKRSWRNKSAILGPSQPLVLTVPLQKGKHQQMMIRDVRIAYDEPWQKIHWNAIQSAYGKTAFFDEVAPGLEAIYHSSPESLWNLNLTCIAYLTELLSGEWKWEMTEQYHSMYPKSVLDLRGGIAAGISSLLPVQIPSYAQVQRMHKTHLPNLCILDALCHLGPDTNAYLFRYATKLYEKP